jgi:hypothetical protein
MLSFSERKKLFEKNKIIINKSDTKKENLNKSFAKDSKKEDNNAFQRAQTVRDNNPFLDMMNQKKLINQINKEIQDNKIIKEKRKNDAKKDEKNKNEVKSDNKNPVVSNKFLLKRATCIIDKEIKIETKEEKKEIKETKEIKKENKEETKEKEIKKENKEETKEAKEIKKENKKEAKETKEETKEIKKEPKEETKETKAKKILSNNNYQNYMTYNPQKRNSSTPILDILEIKSDNKEDNSESFDYFKAVKEDFAEFGEERKYNSNNIEKGKQFFKHRYTKEKIDEIDSTIKKMAAGQMSLPDIKKNPFVSRSSTAFAYLKSKNYNNYERESEARKCQTEFLLIVEKAIISFNIKKYTESYTYLINSGIIKDSSEFGEFLLVVSGFDKTIVGEFLAKEKKPNENKEILNSFINAIDMNYNNIGFLECLRFLLTRLILPKDANLILVIMDTFSEKFFENNKNDKNFVKIFSSTNAVYLLVSTIMALNTMFTRTDIKNMNVIKKPEFISMNKDISPEYVDELYDA